jgi:hypothetical protein
MNEAPWEDARLYADLKGIGRTAYFRLSPV